MATIYNIPIELNSTGRYTLVELKEKLMAYATMLVSLPRESIDADKSRTAEHTDWVKNMSKYRILAPVDEKQSLLEALDEKYR